jgi:tetratricopeptide (TPR) repeat protein
VRPALADLAGDPRSMTAEGFVNLASLFRLETAYYELFADVARGADPVAAKVAFAREAHYSERYDLSLAILDGILRERPDEVEALVLRGDVLSHLERYGEARAELTRALELAPGHRRALSELALVLWWTRDWPALVEVAGESLAGEEESSPRIREEYARALVELGRYDEAEAAVPDPGDEGFTARRYAGIRALSALRRGEPERARAIVDEYSERPDALRPTLLLRAAHRAALLRTGRAADPLPPRDRESLIDLGLEDLLEDGATA